MTPLFNQVKPIEIKNLFFEGDLDNIWNAHKQKNTKQVKRNKNFRNIDMLGTVTSAHHEEGVTDPHAAPARGTLRDGDVLAVDGDGDGRSFAYGAAADVRFDLLLLHGHHGKRSGGRQPVGLIVPAGVVTDVSGVAVQEGHAVEAREAGAGQTCQGPTTREVKGHWRKRQNRLKENIDELNIP